MKKNSILVMTALISLLTSCEEKGLDMVLSDKSIGINATLCDFVDNSAVSQESQKMYKVTTRAIETTSSNLDCFYLSSFMNDDDNYMSNVPYLKQNSVWSTTAGKFYWPVEGDLHFYGYAPETPGKSGIFQLDKDAQTLTDFSPKDAAADQKDFVYCYTKGEIGTNGTTDMNMNFKHALSNITVAAKNDSPDYTVGVTGVRIGNVKGKGTFTFPAVGSTNNEGSWSLSNETTDNVSYETTWTNAALLGRSASMMDASNEAFMLLPQQLVKADKASDKAYIALKVNINATTGQTLYNDWAYIGIDTDWKMGKRYNYTLDFTNGAGQQNNGDPVLVLIKGTSNSSNSFWININESKMVYVDANGKFVFNVGPYSSVTNMHDMFQSCGSLTSLDLSGWNTSNVTDMNGMFRSCNSLTSLDLSGWDTSSVTNMRGMFIYCHSLTSLDVSHFNTSNVTDMSHMFESCESLTSLDLSGFNTEKVTDMSYMFRSCNSLTSLDLSGFNTSKVFNMSYMFRSCNSLTSLDLSGWDTSKVTNMYGMFIYCHSLTSLDLSGWDTSSVTNMSEMFESCESLTSLDLSGWDTSKVTNMYEMFYGCTSLKTIRMVGCSEATINKIKAHLATDGITSCTIVTE